MSTFTKHDDKAVESAKATASADAISEALNAMTLDDDSAAASLFAKAFPAIAAARARGLPAKQIIARLSDMGLRLHHASFRMRFNAEMKLHNDRGERMCCITCGHPVTPRNGDDATESEPSMDVSGHAAGGDV